MNNECNLKKKANKKQQLLLVAYAFSPVLGSEYRSPWELLKKISLDYDVTLIYGDSDGLIGSFDNMNEYLKKNKLNFEAIALPLSDFQKSIAKLMLKAPWALFFPLLLKSWHKKAFMLAKRLHSSKSFDIAHQLGPIGFRNPGYLWKLDCHTYWGPIGGAQYINLKMIKNKKSTYYLEALVRNFSVKIQSKFSYIANAARGFDRVSFATTENKEYFSRYFSRTGPVISDQGLYLNNKKTEKSNDKLKIGWAGSLTSRKNVDALIDVISLSSSNIEFHIMGTGPKYNEIKRISLERDNVNFYGKVKRDYLMKVLRNIDVILLTSLSEANTAILFEAIENDCIPIVPNVNGFATTINNDVGFLIEQFEYNDSINRIIEALNILEVKVNRQKYYNSLLKYKKNLTWEYLSSVHMEQYV